LEKIEKRGTEKKGQERQKSLHSTADPNNPPHFPKNKKKRKRKEVLLAGKKNEGIDALLMGAKSVT